MNKPSTKELLSPFTFFLWTGGCCVALYLIAMSSKSSSPSSSPSGR